MLQEERETSQEVIRQLAQKFYADRSRALLHKETWKEEDIFDFVDNFTALLQVADRETDLDFVIKETVLLPRGDSTQIRARLFGIVETSSWHDYVDLFYQRPANEQNLKTIFYLRYSLGRGGKKEDLVGNELHIIKEPDNKTQFLASHGRVKSPIFNSGKDFDCYFFEPTMGQVRNVLSHVWRSRFHGDSFEEIDITEKIATLAESALTKD